MVQGGRDLVGGHRLSQARRARELASCRELLAFSGGPLFGEPPRKSAIKHGDGIVSHPVQKPPEPAGIDTCVLIVRNHLHPVRDSKAAEGAAQYFSIRERVPPVFASAPPREIAAEMRV